MASAIASFDPGRLAFGAVLGAPLFIATFLN